MIRNLLIVASVTLNALLAYHLLSRTNSEQSAPVDTASVLKAAISISPPAGPAPEPVYVTTSKPIDTTGDYFEYLDSLRAQDLPEELIRQLLYAIISQDYRDLEKLEENEEYWKLNRSSRKDQLLRKLVKSAEKRDLLRQLFGDEVENDPAFEDLFKPYNASLGFLDSEKQLALQAAVLTNQAKVADLFGSGFTREAMRDRQLANEDLQAGIQEILTADEYLEYQLRESRTAEMMRRTLDGMDYSEQEFRDLYAIRSEFDEQLQGGDFFRGSSRSQAGTEIRDERDQRVREYLGDDRYQEYARLQDPVFRSLLSIAERYNTGESTMIEVYEVSTDSTARINDIRNDDSGSREERRAAIQVINDETNEQVIELVGEEVAQSIRENSTAFRFRRPRPRR